MRAVVDPRKATLATFFVGLMLIAPLAAIGIAAPVAAQSIGGPIFDEPAPAPQSHANGDPFWQTLDGFSTKSGYRMVFAWSTSEPIAGAVRWGFSADALDNIVVPVGNNLDTAQLAFMDTAREDIGKTVYFEVVDQNSGTVSPLGSFRLGNAWNSDVSDGVYEINAVLQLDSKSLPDNVPIGAGLNDLALGIDVLAERIWDYTDGHVRLGKIIVTDTAAQYPLYQPAGPGVCPSTQDVEGAAVQHTMADFVVQTTIPFDSHTWGGGTPVIDHPCTAFYIGRIGQLIASPWSSDAHLGYVMAHELGHYAFGLPDLYEATRAGGCANRDPNHPAYDVSVMHNSGGWTGSRWDLSELDRGSGDCDRTVGSSEVSWDALRQWYPNIPDTTSADIVRDDSDPTLKRGNPDGDALDVYLMAQVPGASTMTHFIEAPKTETAADVRITSPASGSEVPPTALTIIGTVDRFGEGNAAPVPTLSASPNSGDPPLNVTFTLGGVDPDGTVASWTLDFGDGSTEDGSGSPPSTRAHTYSEDETFTATLTLVDQLGATGRAEALIIVGGGGAQRIGTDPAGDAPTSGTCGSGAVACQHEWTAAATPGMDLVSAHVQDVGPAIRFAWKVVDAEKFFIDPSGDPASGGPHILGYQFSVSFRTTPATMYTIDIERERGSGTLSASLGRQIGVLIRPEALDAPANWSPDGDIFWIDVPKETFPELSLVGELTTLRPTSGFTQVGANNVNLLVTKDNIQSLEDDSFTIDGTISPLGLGPSAFIAPREPPTTVPPSPHVVDATGDVTIAGLPVDHMDVQAAWFDNDADYLYAGLKVKDIPVDPATTSQIAYTVNFRPDWTSSWGTGGTFTGLRVLASLSAVGLSGSTLYAAEGVHRFELQALSTSGATSSFTKLADLPLSDIDPATDIIWFVIPKDILREPPVTAKLTNLGANTIPAVNGIVTMGSAYGDGAVGAVSQYRFVLYNRALSATTTGPYLGVAGRAIAVEALADGGIPAYTCSWTTPDTGLFGNASACATDVTFPTAGDKRLSVTVSDAEGNTTTVHTTAIVTEPTDERVEIRLSGDLLGAAPVYTTGNEKAADWTRVVDLTGRSGSHVLTATWVDHNGTILDHYSAQLLVGDGPAAFVTLDSPDDGDLLAGIVVVSGEAGHGSGSAGDAFEAQSAFGPNGLFQDAAFVTRSGSVALSCLGCEGLRQNGTEILAPDLSTSVTFSAGGDAPDAETNGIDGRWFDVAGFVGAEYRLSAAGAGVLDIYFFNAADRTQADTLGSATGPDAVKTGVVPAGANWAFVYLRRANLTADTSGANEEARLTMTPPLSAPRALTGSAAWDSTTLGWTIPEWDGGAAIVRYSVYRDGVLVKNVTTTTASDSGLTAGATYTYTVRAVNVLGVIGPESTALSLTTGNDITAPTALTGLTGTPTGPGSASLSWSASLDPESGISHYQVKRDNVPIGTTTTTAYSEAGLREGTTYVYTVVPVNGQGGQGIGQSVEVTTPLTPITEIVSLYAGDVLIQNVTIDTNDTFAPWSAQWDTRLFDDGVHTLRAVYSDGRGGSSFVDITVEIDNIPPDPQAHITAPAAGSTVETPLYLRGDFTTLGDQTAQHTTSWEAFDPVIQDWLSDPWVLDTLHSPVYRSLALNLSQLDGFLSAFPSGQNGQAIVVLLEGDVPADAPTSGLGVPVRYVTDAVAEPLVRLLDEADDDALTFSVQEFLDWDAHHTTPAAPGVQQGIGPGGAIKMRNRDAGGVYGTYSCTASYLFEDPFTGKYYLATAGHCLMDVDKVSSEAEPGARSAWVDVCVSNCYINYLTTGPQQVYVRLTPNATYHPVAYAYQGDIGMDFGLIEIPSHLNQYLRPHMWLWGGPTKMGRATTGDILSHYGHGIGVGATFASQGRLGVNLLSAKETGIQAVGWVMGGDSGSAVGTTFPANERLLHGDAATGAITHSIRDIGLPIFWGTDLERGLEMAGRPYLRLVHEDAAIRPAGELPGEQVGKATILSPSAGATLDPADGPITVSGTATFNASGEPDAGFKTYYLHRDGCGTGETLWMDEVWFAEETGNGCGSLAHPIGPVWEAVIGSTALTTTYPALPVPDADIYVDDSRDILAEVFVTDAAGFNPVTVLLDYEARLSYNGTIVAERRVQEPVVFTDRLAVNMTPLVDEIPAFSTLRFTFVVHQSTNPMFLAYGGLRASNVQIPLAGTPALEVQVAVDDPDFAAANRLSVSGTETWSAVWDLTGLAHGKHTVYARTLVDGKTDGDYSSRDVFLFEHVPVPPTASFEAMVTDLMVQFNDTSVAGDAPIVAWAWDFGDGATSAVQDPTHTFATDGTYPVTLTVTDADGLSDSTSVNVTVELGIIEYFVEVRLVGPLGEVFGWTRVAEAVEGEEGDWSMLWDPESPLDGVYTAEVRMLRDTLPVFSENRTFTLDNNVAPVVAPLAPQAVEENSLLTFGVTATDLDGDALTLGAEALPTGASFTDNGDGTGVFSWTPATGTNGVYTVNFTADDGRLTAQAFATITVFEEAIPPVLDPIADQFGTEGQPLVFAMTGSDINGDTLTLTVSPLPTGAKVTKTAAGAWSFTWTPGYRQNGVYALTATLSDGTFSVTDAFNVTITDVDVPPEVWNARDQTVIVGTQTASYVDARDLDGDLITLSATGMPGWATFTDMGSGRGRFELSPPPHESGFSYTVTVTAASTDHVASKTFKLSAIGFMELSVVPVGNGISNAIPGVAHPLGAVVRNTGTAPGWVHFSGISSRAGWSVSAPADVYLAAGETVTLPFSVVPGDSGSSATITLRAVARDFASTQAAANYLVRIPVNLAVVFDQTSAVFGTVGTVRATFLDGSPAAGVEITVTDTHQLGQPFVNTASGVSDVDGNMTFSFDMNSPGGQLPGDHRLFMEGLRDSRRDTATARFTVLV